MTVNVPLVPPATLGFVQVGGNAPQVQPAGGVIETNVVFAGVFSVNVAVVAAVVPVFVTTCVNVMGLPACTGFGEATLVTVKSGAVVPTIVVAVAVLFATFGSVAEEFADTASVITVPLAVPLFTFTIRVNAAKVEPGMLTSVQTTLPVPPAPGFAQTHPAGAAIDTSVVFAGIVATTVALSAALGPLLVTICV